MQEEVENRASRWSSAHKAHRALLKPHLKYLATARSTAAKSPCARRKKATASRRKAVIAESRRTNIEITDSTSNL